MNEARLRVGDEFRGVQVILPRAAQKAFVERKQIFLKPKLKAGDIGRGAFSFAEPLPRG